MPAAPPPEKPSAWATLPRELVRILAPSSSRIWMNVSPVQDVSVLVDKLAVSGQVEWMASVNHDGNPTCLGKFQEGPHEDNSIRIFRLASSKALEVQRVFRLIATARRRLTPAPGDPCS